MGKNRMGAVESDVANLGDMFVSYLERRLTCFMDMEVLIKEMSMGLGGISNPDTIDGSMLESEENLDELDSRIAIIDGKTTERLTKEKKETEARKAALKGGNSHITQPLSEKQP